MQPDSIGLLRHIQRATEFIADTEGATLETFLADRKLQQLVERNLTIIGEAVNRLSQHDPEAAKHISQVPGIVGMRNILIHAYTAINYRTVWRTVQNSLPVLRAEVETLLDEVSQR